jgi:hypothetical protein
MKPLTLEEAKNLQFGQVLFHTKQRNADKTPQRWRVNGKPKTWKRSPERVSVPVKSGLYSYDHITERDLELVSLTEK